jgi:hypothetical protein
VALLTFMLLDDMPPCCPEPPADTLLLVLVVVVSPLPHARTKKPKKIAPPHRQMFMPSY